MARNFVAASSNSAIASAAAVTGVPLTVACWFNPVSNAVVYNLMSLDDGSNANRFYLRQNAASHVVFGVSATSAITSTSTTAAVWQHACGVGASITS